ncbi:hypothetical protein [Bacillus coahuilensis]|uniref:hypothetical protein n=1 Tax=Bacillus coahuilensis TaxID=408580 RepID=UPI00018506DD|nr:hypothetical protein [Bacillus coahuilensis]
MHTIESHFEELNEDYKSLREYVEQLKIEEHNTEELGSTLDLVENLKRENQALQNAYDSLIEEKKLMESIVPSPLESEGKDTNVDLQIVEWLMNTLVAGNVDNNSKDMEKLIEKQIEKLTKEITSLEGERDHHS